MTVPAPALDSRTRLDLRTYLVTDAALSGPRGVLEVVRAAVDGGVTTVQLREKNASARELYELTLRAAELTAGRATLLVDDRVDVFLAARAAGAAVDGVHVGQSDLPADRVRAIVDQSDAAGRARAVIGLTANTPEHLTAVTAAPAGTVDYLGIGVIRPTSTKPDHPAPLGVDGFARLAAATPLPCVAIGGVALGDLAALRRAGAQGVAVVSAICAADDPRAAAAAFAAGWDAA